MRYRKISLKALSTHSIKIVSLIASLLLAGCGSVYREPTTDPKASIKFINESADAMSVQFYEGASECTNRTFAGLVEQKSTRSLSVLAEKDVALTVAMDPGERLAKSIAVAAALGGAFGGAAGAAVGQPLKKCFPTIQFTPEAGASYVFRMRSDGNQCAHAFYAEPSSARGGDKGRPVQTVDREWVRAFGESGPWCKRNG